MTKQETERRLGAYLTFLEERLQEVQVISLPPPPEGKAYPLSYYQNQAQEAAYRRAEQELRRLFPEIDI